MKPKLRVRTVVLSICLILAIFITYRATRPPTLKDVFHHSDARNLPEGATNIVVKGGKQGLGVNFYVGFEADPEESRKWLTQYRAEQDGSGDYIFGGLPGPNSPERLGVTKVRLGQGNKVSLFYNHSL